MAVLRFALSRTQDSARRRRPGRPRSSGRSRTFFISFFSIPWKTTEEELKQHFSKFGNIVFANIKKDPETGNSRGFGFIRFENYESQKKAMEEATHEIDERAVVLRLTKKVS